MSNREKASVEDLPYYYEMPHPRIPDRVVVVIDKSEYERLKQLAESLKRLREQIEQKKANAHTQDHYTINWFNSQLHLLDMAEGKYK